MPLGNPGVIGQILDGSSHRSPIESIRHRRAQHAAAKRRQEDHVSYLGWLRTAPAEEVKRRQAGELEIAKMSEWYLPRMLEMQEDDPMYRKYWQVLMSNFNRISTSTGQKGTTFSERLPTNAQDQQIYDRTDPLRRRHLPVDVMRASF